MKKPLPWAEPATYTVEPPDRRKRQMNPADKAAASDPSTGQKRKPAALPKSAGRSSESVPLPSVTVPPKTTTASPALLGLLGHSESCIELTRAGAITSCDCRIRPMENPGVAVALAVHYARISIAQRIALPTVIIELLARRVEDGDPACVAVAEWLDASGLLDLKPLPRSKKKRTR